MEKWNNGFQKEGIVHHGDIHAVDIIEGGTIPSQSSRGTSIPLFRSGGKNPDLNEFSSFVIT